MFTFQLRPRFIQTGVGAKLICCVAGFPLPTVTWQKDGRDVDESKVNVVTRHGVCTLELFSVKLSDGGKYTCWASNRLGQAETSCVLTVQGRKGEAEPAQPRALADSSSRSARRILASSLLDMDESPVVKSRSAADLRPDRSRRERITDDIQTGNSRHHSLSRI